MIGLIPAAGKAARIHGLPKFLLPVNDTYLLEFHVSSQRRVTKAVFIGSSPENLDLLEDYTGSKVYRAENYGTMTQTILSWYYDHTAPIVDENILFSMCDTYIEDDNCYAKLSDAIHNGADVAVGVFYARNGQHTKAGMCKLDGERVIDVIDKPAQTDYRWLWGALAWKPAFWEYMKPEDSHVGYALPRAIAAGLDVRAVRMTGGYWDCGTYDEYAELIVHLHGRKTPAEMHGLVEAMP